MSLATCLVSRCAQQEINTFLADCKLTVTIMAASNVGASNAFLSVVAAVPLMICVRDSFYSLCKVKGSSMDPSLKNGDVLLIRKADFPVLRWNRNNDVNKSDFGDDDNNNNTSSSSSDQHHNGGGHDDVSGPMMRNRRLREYEYQHHLARHDSTVWFRCPPWPMRGQIVTYRSPYQYPSELCVKRVVGVAGQVVRKM